VKAEDKQIYKLQISKINERRRKYWSDLRALRNDIFLRYRDNPDGPVKITDSDAIELLQTVHDMWESGSMEDMRRSSETHRSRTMPRCPVCSAPMNDFIPKKKVVAGGLYTSDKLCKVCGLPLSGRQKAYCREECRGIARSRKWRTNNPDAKAKSNKKYLNKYY